MRAPFWICLLGLGLWLGGCRSASTQPLEQPPISLSANSFSGDAAYAHLKALAALGPRVTGTPGAEQARAYLDAELKKIGVEVEDVDIEGAVDAQGAPRKLENVVAKIPGESAQLIVLAAPYDTRRFESFTFVGANDGASGPALLLELARVLAASKPRYTIWIVFLDGEAPLMTGPDPNTAPQLAGSRALTIQLAQSGTPPVRLAVFFQQVGDADLRIARDLRSHRLFREEFWLAANRLGKTDAFRPAEPFETPLGSHLPLVAAGYRGVVLLTDPAYGGADPPGAFANSEDDTPERCSAASLATVGSVTLDALEHIEERLAKIDRLAKPPDAGEPPTAEPPAPPTLEPAAPPPPDAATPPAPSAPSATPAPAPPTGAPSGAETAPPPPENAPQAAPSSP
jgi:hypothetical protein